MDSSFSALGFAILSNLVSPEKSGASLFMESTHRVQRKDTEAVSA